LLLIDLIKEQDVDLMARAAEGSLQKLLKNIINIQQQFIINLKHLKK
jgi:hypothetical protein